MRTWRVASRRVIVRTVHYIQGVSYVRMPGRHKRVETSDDPRRRTTLQPVSCQIGTLLLFPRPALDIPVIMTAPRRRGRTINNNRKIIIQLRAERRRFYRCVWAANRALLWIAANCEEWPTRVSADRWFDIRTLSWRTRPRANDPSVRLSGRRILWSRSRTEARTNRVFFWDHLRWAFTLILENARLIRDIAIRYIIVCKIYYWKIY